MQGQYPRRKYAGKHTALRRKGQKRVVLGVAFTMIIAVALIFTIIFFRKSENKLVGTWVYDEYTQYVFEESGHGELLADDVSFEYTYKINGETLTLDFTEDVVRDCDYTFSVDGKKLTLKGGTGTDGGTYTLNKK